MKKLIKIGEIESHNTEELKKIGYLLESNGYTVFYDEIYPQCLYIALRKEV